MATLPAFTFSDTLVALDMGAPALRRWLQFGLVSSGNRKGRGTLIEFEPFDLAVLALVKQMSEFGIPVTAAHRLAVHAMREHAGPWSGDEPLIAYWSAWRGQQLAIRPKAGKDGKTAWGLMRFEGEEASAWSSPAFLVLDPERLIRGVLERALGAAEARERRRA